MTDAATKRRAKAQTDFDNLCEDIEWLLDGATHPADIVARVGYAGRVHALDRRLARRGRHDLAHKLRLTDGTVHDSARKR